MAKQTPTKRTFESEIKTLPLHLVPPDPFQSERTWQDPRTLAALIEDQPAPERDTLARLIKKIQKI